MRDPYLQEGTAVLKNKLDIRNGQTLDLIEAEQSRLNMMLLYEAGFDDFTPRGLAEIHRHLFGDIYDWAGEYRIINIEKREQLLAGRSVWYSNDEAIDDDLQRIFSRLRDTAWESLTHTHFVEKLCDIFPAIWRVHPFREGNTRVVVMLLTFFVERYGYYMNQDLMAASAGYVRDSFVMASLDEQSERQHLEHILMDAVSEEPIGYDEANEDRTQAVQQRRYQSKPYEPQPHYKV